MEDVAFKVIAMTETPDHATIARFVDRHEAALGELFGQVLALCDEAGLVRPGVVAIDGTRLAGNASRESTRDFGQIAREILAEAKAVERPRTGSIAKRAEMSCLSSCAPVRAARSSFAKPVGWSPRPRICRQRRPRSRRSRSLRSMPSGSWRAARDARGGHATRTASSSAAAGSAPILSRARDARLLLAAERLEAERDGQVAASWAYEHYRTNGRDTQGRKLGRRPKPWTAPDIPGGVVSVSDPDTQRMKANHGYVEGYNAQAVVDEGQIVLAAELTNSPADFSQLDPMLTVAIAALEQAGVSGRPQVALADAQYWNEQHMARSSPTSTSRC